MQTNQTPSTQVYKSPLAKMNDTFLPQIEDQLSGNGIHMTEYQRTCVLNSMSAINEMLVTEGLAINEVDQSNLTQTLLNVAALQLNATATPREVYFIKRNQSRGKDKPKVPVIEMGIEGDGNDAILARFGRNVKTVHRHWEVREHDGFTYPGYAGLSVTPPTWSPTGKGKVIRVVYPIEYVDGQIEYFIAEREDVKANLLAHMFNNLMWDKNKVDKKKKIKEFADTNSIDAILDNEEMQTTGNISSAWKEPQSRESMIIRKMRNRIVKKVPKDFSNAYVASAFEGVEDDYETRQLERKEAEIINEIDANANTEILDPVPPKQPEPTKPKNIDQSTGEIIDSQPEPAQEALFDNMVDTHAPSETPAGSGDPY